MRHFIILPILLSLLFSCKNSNTEKVEEHLYTNDLIHESSPYLLQHAHNPVNWKPWGPDALNEAKNSKKLMVVSIGYAACHWCHVMERESFEDSTVASIMNKNYISIKVDREERPDVDQTYINAVQLMTGNAGWPLNVITLPDGRPIFGGTYFKKEDWMQALEQIQSLYESEPQKLEEYASRLEEGIKSLDLVTLNKDEINFSQISIDSTLRKLQNNFDTVDGGSRGAPKFMMPNQLAYFMRLGFQNNVDSFETHVETTLTKIGYGGVYDHVGGGFARYSTDDRWHVPHFEKMLYDNAQLVSVYSNAYKATPKEAYKRIVEETLAYIEREMTDASGAFYSSLDADSTDEDGVLKEGAFYIYSNEELQSIIPSEDWELFSAYFNINEKGLWKEENKYVLYKDESTEKVAEQFSLSTSELIDKVNRWKTKLFEYREKRPKTRLDDKTLTSWNALMIQGYLDAYKAFGNPSYLSAAQKSAALLRDKQMNNDGSLWHTFKNGKSAIPGYLEDYAALAKAFITMHEVTLEPQWIMDAKALMEYAFDHFFDEENQMFYFTSSKEEEILSRNFEYRDNVIPSSNSIIAKNLAVLAHHFDDERYRDTSRQMLKNVLEEMMQYPSSFTNWLDLLEDYRSKFYEVVVVGENALEITSELNSHYVPNTLITGSINPPSGKPMPLLEERYVPGRTLIYVCVNNTCKLPVERLEEALKLIQ